MTNKLKIQNLENYFKKRSQSRVQELRLEILFKKLLSAAKKEHHFSSKFELHFSNKF
jgi:hypothetical protein